MTAGSQKIYATFQRDNLWARSIGGSKLAGCARQRSRGTIVAAMRIGSTIHLRFVVEPPSPHKATANWPRPTVAPIGPGLSAPPAHSGGLGLVIFWLVGSVSKRDMLSEVTLLWNAGPSSFRDAAAWAPVCCSKDRRAHRRRASSSIVSFCPDSPWVQAQN
jgi:hypothetical protein